MEKRLKNNFSNTASLAVMLDFELGTREGKSNALEPQNHTKSAQSDQNVIPFTKRKRTENIEKSTFSVL